jgi:DHA1 family tetracycline resistance protein-like MFS transporter
MQNAIYGGWLLALFSLVQFFASPILGSLSDRFGRRPVLVVSLTAIAVDYLCYGLAPTIGWLFLSDILAGVFSATLSTASAYIADVTPPHGRARRFGMLTAAYGVGLTMGPMLVAALEGYSTRMPFFVVSGLALLNAVYGLMTLPESLPMENRRAFSILAANPLTAVMHIGKDNALLYPLGSLGLMQIAALTVPVMWSYSTSHQFGWSQREIGLSLSLYASTTIVSQSLIVGPVNRKLGALGTARVGFTFMIIGLLGCAFATQSWLMVAFTIPTALGSVAVAALLSHLSNHVPADSQGELQGTVACMASATAFLTPLLMTEIFSSFSATDSAIHLSGMPYLIAAISAILGLFLTIITIRNTQHLTVNDIHSDGGR